jgi:hypothetical protein
MEHPKLNVNDVVALFEERPDLQGGKEDSEEGVEDSKKRGPSKGESWGLAHHLQKVIVWLIGNRVRGSLDEATSFNILFIILTVFRAKKNKEIGLHYLQFVLDRLARKCEWVDQGPLKDHFTKVDKDLIDKLVDKFGANPVSKSSGEKGGGKGKGRLGPGRFGINVQYQKKWSNPPQYRPPPQWSQYQQYGNKGGGPQAGQYQRPKEIQKGGPGGGPKGGPKGGKKGGAGKGALSQASPEVKRAFEMCRDGKFQGSDGRNLCPFYQTTSCLWGRDCRQCHECPIDGGRHGANNCRQINEPEARRKLGL